MNSYERLNHIYRALDIYNFPNGIPLTRQLQALRVLHENRYHRNLPTKTELDTRLQNLSYEIYNSQDNTQLIHELIDTALEIGISLPMIETQRNLFREYERQIPHEQTIKPISDLYSLKTITEDSQNVHHTSINEHIKTIVKQIVIDYPPQNSAWSILKSELQKRHSWKNTNQETLKFIYENPCRFTIDITLKQLTISVFLFIAHQQEDIREQLYQRFNEELDEMRGKCSTGHMSRLVNIVQGFSDQYTIQILPKEEIKSFVYHYLTKRLEEAPEDVQEGILEHTSEFKNYIFNDQYRAFFISRFGTEHTDFIDKCIHEYVS
jgi:hypothetical protein